MIISAPAQVIRERNICKGFPYLETALKHNAVLVSMDDKDFLMRIKGKGGIEVYHTKDLTPGILTGLRCGMIEQFYISY